MTFLQNYKIEKIINFSKTKFGTFLIFTIFSLVSFPNTLNSTNAGLDASWAVAKIWPKLLHFPFNYDIGGEFGPLGYLIDSINIDHNYWVNTFLFHVGTYFFVFSILAIFSFKQRMSLRNVIILGIISIFIAKVTEDIYFAALGLLIAYFIYLTHYKEKFILIPLSFICAFLLFIKFDGAIISFGILATFCVLLLYKKRWKETIVCLSSYVSFSLLIWFIIGGSSIVQLIHFVANSIDQSSGYTAAVSLDAFQILSTPLAIFAWFVFLISFGINKLRPPNSNFLILSIIPLFVYFKLGIVRNDLHVETFFSYWALVLFLYYSSLSNLKSSSVIKLSAYILCILLLLCQVYLILYPDFPNEIISNNFLPKLGELIYTYFLSSNIQHLPIILNVLFDSKTDEKIINSEKQNIILDYPKFLPVTINLLKNNTTEIFPWDVTLLYAYGMEWNPWSMIEPYSAFTSKSDMSQAKHLLYNETSPEFIIFGPGSIDNRYPFFDEPSTIRAILCHYETVGPEATFWILKKNTDNCTTPKQLLTNTVKFNQTVILPYHTSDYLFAKIHIKYSILGKLSEIFYKPSQIHVIINNDKSYRFVFKTAENGILLATSDTAKKAFPMLSQDVKTLRFTTDEWYYDQNIEIEYICMNYTHVESHYDNIITPQDPVELIENLYNGSNDLQSIFPEVKGGNLGPYLGWVRTTGIKEYWELNETRPLMDLLQVYYSNKTLQREFPDLHNNNQFKNLVSWGLNHGVTKEQILEPDKDYFNIFLIKFKN